MEYDKYLAIPSFINTWIWTINVRCGRYKFYKIIEQHALLPPMYQKDSFPSELLSSASSTKKSSIQAPKYSHWPEYEFCLPQ